MKTIGGLIGASLGILLLTTACTESGAGGREINITQSEDACGPERIKVTPGEKVQFVVKNDSSHDVYEVEGVEGTKLEEFVVPAGKTRKAGYTVPGGDGTYKLKCYVPAGPSTIIELVAGIGGTAGGPTAEPEEEAGGVTGPADDTVNVGLAEYVVTSDKASVKAGAIKFVAANNSASQVHELAVLKKMDDGQFDNEGEIEDIAASEGGEVILELEPGDYELACLIAAGESGSTVDHYEQGMKIAFTVTE
jgi:plastocyanin